MEMCEENKRKGLKMFGDRGMSLRSQNLQSAIAGCHRYAVFMSLWHRPVDNG